MAGMSRRDAIRWLGGAGALSMAGRFPTPAAGGEGDGRPNFLFILTDDQRHDALGCAGNPSRASALRIIQTPNLDRLAARGTRFENAFVTLSICSPSRAACLTGRYGSATGVTRVGAGLREGERTLAHTLTAAGYRAGMIGKWHLDNTPEELGFETADYFTSNGRYYGRHVNEGGGRKTIEGFIEDYNADRSIRFLEESRGDGRPFFLFHCTQVPHMNHEFDWNARPDTLALYDPDAIPAPETWRDDLRGKPPYLREARSRTKALEYGYDGLEAVQRHHQRYYAAITEMDASLGRLLDALDRLGLRENTHIVFMGDNGWFLGEHGFTSKVLAYEESIRVPMILAGPGIRRGVESRLALNVDLAPTILEWAGMPVPETMHGSSLVPLARGAGGAKRSAFMRVTWRDSIFYEAPDTQLGSYPLYALRTDGWKYIQTRDIDAPERVYFEELYDLAADPIEMNNLAGTAGKAERLGAMRAELESRIGNPAGNGGVRAGD